MCGRTKEIMTDVTTTNNERIVCNNTNSNVSSPERDIDDNGATNYIISNANKRNNSNRYQLGNSDTTNNCDSLQDRRFRQLRRQADWQWLHACIGIELN